MPNVNDDDLREEEAERLWAEEAQRRLEAFRAGRARSVSASEVAEKVKTSCGDSGQIPRRRGKRAAN